MSFKHRPDESAHSGLNSVLKLAVEDDRGLLYVSSKLLSVSAKFLSTHTILKETPPDVLFLRTQGNYGSVGEADHSRSYIVFTTF